MISEASVSHSDGGEVCLREGGRASEGESVSEGARWGVCIMRHHAIEFKIHT